MNSCTSTFESACAPPLRMFIIGTGNSRSPPPSARDGYSGFSPAAAACAAAIDTPRMAFAPSSWSACRRGRSFSCRASWSNSPPTTALAISPFTFATALARLCPGSVSCRRRAARALRARPSTRPTARRRAAECAARERDVDFNSGISTRIQNFSSMHAGDFQDLSPVVFGFDAERFFADGFNKRIVVFGDDDNSEVRHSMSLSIFFGLNPMTAPRGISTSRSMMARRIRVAPTRTPGISMLCSMSP